MHTPTTRSTLAPARLETCQRCGATAPALPLAEPRRPIHAQCGGRIRFRLLTTTERTRLAAAIACHSLADDQRRSSWPSTDIPPNHRRSIRATEKDSQ